jgi:hypothetical protein
MKQQFYKISWSVLLVIFVANFLLAADDQQKVVSKSFNINGNTQIEISNFHGNVLIKRWDKNVLDLKVTIDAKGSNEEQTQKILDAIEISISDRISSGKLAIETEIGRIKGNSSFTVNYEVTMPDTNPLKLSNSFGNVYMGSHKGKLEINVKHGQFQAEDLDEADIEIGFAYARCEVESLKSGRLHLSHSKMMVEEMGDVEIFTQFSNLEIENAGSISLDGKHGEFEIENLRSFKGDIQFAGLKIENLEEALVLETRHGKGINIENISRDFKVIDIDADFSTVDINLQNGATAKLNFNLQFGNLRANGNGINFDKVIKDQTTSEYEGYLGDSNATSSIKVITRHGNIRFDVN